MKITVFKKTSFTRGVTLLEMLIASTIISVAFLSFVASYSSIARSIGISRARTLASNFAQEKIEKLKSQNYYKIIATPVTQLETAVTPSIPYDNAYFPPEEIVTSGQTYKRYTHIENVQELSGNLTTVAANTDTGIKRIRVSILWQENNQYKTISLQNFISNPDITMYTSKFTGKVVVSGIGTPIPNALVLVTENTGWQDLTNATGDYSIDVLQGEYYLNVSAVGYFNASKLISIASKQTLNNDFFLSPMSSGTVRSAVWLNDHIVISQIVASSVTAGMFDQEYVELYNPTTDYVKLIAGGVPQIKLFYQKYDDVSRTEMVLDYNVAESSIAPNSYYLIANTSTIAVMGSTVTADAVYAYSFFPTETDRDIIKSPDAGSVGIFTSPGDKVIDCIGWTRNPGVAQIPKFYEKTPISQVAGFTNGEQYVRRSSTQTSGFTAGYGRCYDSNKNHTDFIDYSFTFSTMPRNSQFSEPPLTGTPAFGAVVSANDGLSGPVSAYPEGTGATPWAEFRLMYIATGTWTIAVTSSSYYTEITSITVTPNSIQWIPNAVTYSSWPVANHHYTVLKDKTEMGFISGRITNGANQPIIPMSVYTMSTVPAAGQGFYIIAATTGACTITANPANANPLYVSESKTVNVESGQITSGVDFVLSQGGRIRGFVTRDGSTPLPNVAVVAFDENSVSRGNDISKANGLFYISNLSTGPYTFEPVLDSKESSIPINISATVTSGCNIHIGTITVIGSLGTIEGSVQVSSMPIQTGVLIVATDATTIAGDPPDISSGTLTGFAYYSTSSLEDGTYSFQVRGSTTSTYNVYAWYPVMGAGGSGVTYSRRSRTGVSVLPGLTTSGQDFTW